MERSSPLAAMQHQPQQFGHGRWNFGMESMRPPTFNNMDMGGSNFNFKELSMKHTGVDYFSMNPGSGGSPTATLAVDLSQNFHIDRSPMPPTPRRSLFTSTMFGNFNGREALSTPPPSTSSPCPTVDSMDVSPLPHKVPHTAAIQIQSPTPEPTPSVDVMQISPSVIPGSPLETAQAKPAVERKRPSLLRPSLSRVKGLTTTSIPTKTTEFDAPPRPFKFGNGSMMPPSSSLSLEECFVESPDQATFPSPAPTTTAMGPPRPKSAYPKANPFATQENGSPGVSHSRRPNAPRQRPRKQFRRSLSMFENANDVLDQQPADPRPECGLQSIMDVDETHQLHLPHFFPENDTIPRITKETMVDILDGKYRQHFDNSLVVDCRFEYEYKGGHIDGAINFNNKEELASKLFLPQSPQSPQNTLLIFHCEYSKHRAPLAARYIRGEDRTTNAHQYPQLTYPEVYILEGGYKAFFENHKTRCFPQNYVIMDDKEHVNACERGLGRIKQHRAKLSRAQTFAFGQPNQMMDESPTAMNKSSSNLVTSMDISLDDALIRRQNARRMASF